MCAPWPEVDSSSDAVHAPDGESWALVALAAVERTGTDDADAIDGAAYETNARPCGADDAADDEAADAAFGAAVADAAAVAAEATAASEALAQPLVTVAPDTLDVRTSARNSALLVDTEYCPTAGSLWSPLVGRRRDCRYRRTASSCYA